MNETPLLRQLLRCEKLIFERGTEYVTLINCFTERVAVGFPALVDEIVIYGLLANGFGPFTMDVRIWNLNSGEEILEYSFPAFFPDRLRTADCITRFWDVSFPEEGKYEVVLLANQETIGATTLNFMEI